MEYYIQVLLFCFQLIPIFQIIYVQTQLYTMLLRRVIQRASIYYQTLVETMQSRTVMEIQLQTSLPELVRGLLKRKVCQNINSLLRLVCVLSYKVVYWHRYAASIGTISNLVMIKNHGQAETCLRIQIDFTFEYCDAMSKIIRMK